MYNLVVFIKSETKFSINAFCVFLILLLSYYINSHTFKGYVTKKDNSYNAEGKKMSFVSIANAQQHVEHIKSDVDVYLANVKYWSANIAALYLPDKITYKTYLVEPFILLGFQHPIVNIKEGDYLINHTLINSYTKRDELIISGKLQSLNNTLNPE